MQFKPQNNPTGILSIAKDPSAPRFQIFLDLLAVPVILIGQTIIASTIKNFDDNYLCLFFILKLVIDGLFYMFADTEHKSFGKNLFVLRLVFDVLSFIGGYLLMRFEGLHEVCYIVFCTIIFVELSASTICTFMVASSEEEVRDTEASPVGHYEVAVTSDASPMSGTETAFLGKDKSPAKSSMISGSTMAGSVQSFVSGRTAF